MYAIEVRGSGNGDMTVELRGELDVASVPELRATLDHVASFRRLTTIDLSGVTFLDLQSTRELAVRSQIYARHLTLANPSWQARASVEACNLQDWVRFEQRVVRPGPRPLKKVS